MATKIEVTGGQDFLIHEEDYRYCRVAGTVTPAAAVSLNAGVAVTGTAATTFVPYTNASGTVTGLLMVAAPGLTAATASEKVPILNLGPAVVDKGSLFDLAGAALDAAGIAALVALGIKVVDPADLIEEGNPAI